MLCAQGLIIQAPLLIALSECNKDTLHDNLGRMSPIKFHEMFEKQLKKINRRMEIIFNNERV